jgi:NDP-sugar pyrophosphorylase family protein
MIPVAIPAGGLATRLRPLTETIPKALVEINGEPFIAHQLRLLASHGVRRAVLCLGYLGESVREFVGDGARFGLEVACSFDGAAPLGTAGAIREALPLLGERFFVVYGDSYLPCDYATVERAFLDSGRAALMTVYGNQGRWDTSNVEFADGQIRAYDKVNRSPRMGHIDYGLGAFRAEVFERLPAGEPADLARVYQDLLARGELAGFEIRERFYEIGSFQGIADLEAYLKA